MITFPLQSAFIAIPLEGEAKAAFKALRQLLLPHEDVLTLHSPHTPHVTLTYWKSLMEIECDEVIRQAARVAELSSPFELEVRGIETFSSHGEDRVLHLPPVFSPELAALKKRCPWPNPSTSSGQVSQWTPHVTIARVRHANKFRIRKKKILKLLEDADISVHIDRLLLYAKIDGVSQTPLREFVFAQS